MDQAQATTTNVSPSQYVATEEAARYVAQLQLQTIMALTSRLSPLVSNPFFNNTILHPFLPFWSPPAALWASALAATANTSIQSTADCSGSVSAAHSGTLDCLGIPNQSVSKVTDTRMASVRNRPNNATEHSIGMDCSYIDSPVHTSMPQLQSRVLKRIHLRKAKLMFFFVRHPSFSTLQSYFIDICFNKRNLAQLRKWFSNFREYYYKHMEAYANQEVAKGTAHAEDIVVLNDSAIYKHLVLRFNRNNIQPPAAFREVVELTARQFFAAIKAGKHTQLYWKTPIYTVVAQMDSVIPEYFKNPNFLNSQEIICGD